MLDYVLSGVRACVRARTKNSQVKSASDREIKHVRIIFHSVRKISRTSGDGAEHSGVVLSILIGHCGVAKQQRKAKVKTPSKYCKSGD